MYTEEEESEGSCPLSDVSSSSGDELKNRKFLWKLVDGDCAPERVPYAGGIHVVVFYATSSITVRVPKQKESGAVPVVRKGTKRVKEVRRNRTYSVKPRENADVVLEVAVSDGWISRAIVTWPVKS